MREIQTRALSFDDLERLKGSTPLSALLARALGKQRDTPFAAVAEASYGTRLWEQGGLAVGLCGSPGKELPLGRDQRIVGIVTEGVFEIFEVHKGAVADRRWTTLILEPGMTFGLFERYAQWHGPWTIVSGVVSFLVSNPCANEDLWKRRAHRQIAVKDMKLDTASRCEFEALIPDNKRAAWSAKCILLWPDRIEDAALKLEIESALKDKAIAQLYSVHRQEASLRAVEKDGTPPNLFLEYIDSVIMQRTPILQLLDRTDASCLPAASLFDQLEMYGAVKCAWHVFVPRPLKAGSTGMYLADYVPRFPKGAYEWLFDGGGVHDRLRNIGRKRETTIGLEEINGVKWLRYRGNYLIHACTRGPRSQSHPVHLITHGSVGPCSCHWSPHFSQITLVRDVS